MVKNNSPNPIVERTKRHVKNNSVMIILGNVRSNGDSLRAESVQQEPPAVIGKNEIAENDEEEYEDDVVDALNQTLPLLKPRNGGNKEL